MGVLTFSTNWDQAEGKLLGQGNSSMASNSGSAVGKGNVEYYVDNAASESDLVLAVPVGLDSLEDPWDLLWLQKPEFEDLA